MPPLKFVRPVKLLVFDSVNVPDWVAVSAYAPADRVELLFKVVLPVPRNDTPVPPVREIVPPKVNVAVAKLVNESPAAEAAIAQLPPRVIVLAPTNPTLVPEFPVVEMLFPRIWPFVAAAK